LKTSYKKAYSPDKEKIKNIIHIDDLVDWVGSNRKKITKALKKLRAERFIKEKDNGIILTTEGEAMALRMIRSHRLWESYLTDKNILKNIHSDAEEYEHFLTDELLDEIDEQLGYPQFDPHGSPIPPGKRKEEK
jgi:DtxR family transcriptional regulator, Mn-dependent transcriptional regulator